MIQLATEFRRSLVESFGGEVGSLHSARQAWLASPLSCDLVPSPAFRYEMAVDAAHRDAFERSGVKKECPLSYEVKFYD